MSVEEQRFISRSEAETMEIARGVGESAGPGSIWCLYGDLGAGKTRFAKGFAEAFGIPAHEVDSPTFTLIQEYNSNGHPPFYHFDFYRIEDIGEALEIGSEEYFYGEGVSLIEWPERIEELLPDDVIRINLSVIDENSRLIVINYPKEEKPPQ